MGKILLVLFFLNIQNAKATSTAKEVVVTQATSYCTVEGTFERESARKITDNQYVVEWIFNADKIGRVGNATDCPGSTQKYVPIAIREGTVGLKDNIFVFGYPVHIRKPAPNRQLRVKFNKSSQKIPLTDVTITQWLPLPWDQRFEFLE